MKTAETHPSTAKQARGDIDRSVQRRQNGNVKRPEGDEGDAKGEEHMKLEAIHKDATR